MSAGAPSRGSHTAVLVILVATIGLATFQYGSVELAAQEALRFVAIVCVAILLWSESPKALLSRSTTPVLLCGVAFLVWTGIQVVPLPHGVLRLLSPRAAAAHDLTTVPGGSKAIKQWLVAQAERDGIRLEEGATLSAGPDVAGDALVGRTLSLYPAATRRAALSWIAPILLFLVAARISMNALLRYRLLWAISIWGGLYGFAGVAQALGWRGRPLWTVDLSGVFTMMLPFVNRNHYAGLIEMTTLVAIGLALAVLSRATGSLDGRGLRRGLTDRAWALPRLLLLGVLIAAGVGGLLACGSRGGALAFLVGLAFLVAARWIGRVASLVIVLLALLGIGVGAMGYLAPEQHNVEAGLASGAEDSSMVGRFDLWAKTLRMFSDYPLAGTGLGTFEWAFAHYKREGEWAKLDYPHNDYLQALSESGLVGSVLLGAGLLTLLLAIYYPGIGARDKRPRFTTLGALAALTAILTHSVTDCNLQVPSNGALFAILLGVAAAAARDGEPAR